MGSVHLSNGEFVVNKWAKSFSNVMRTDCGQDFLSHMPHSGWTLAHLRAASHGSNAKRNTHPFIVDDWAFIHNGVWHEYRLVKVTMERGRLVKFEGETDSEVAANFMNIVGPKKFTEEVDMGGVFMALNRNGELHVMRTSGDLVSCAKMSSFVIASELPKKKKYRNAADVKLGWYKFNQDGQLVYKRYKPEPFVPTEPSPMEIDEFLDALTDEEYEEYLKFTDETPQGRNEFDETKHIELPRSELERLALEEKYFSPQTLSRTAY